MTIFIYLIIKSSEKDNIPYAHHIGDIIKIHRGLYAPKKKRNVDLKMYAKIIKWKDHDAYILLLVIQMSLILVAIKNSQLNLKINK